MSRRREGAWMVLVRMALRVAMLGAGVSACERQAARLHAQRAAALQDVLDRFHRESAFPGAILGAWFADSTTVVVAAGLADRSAATPMPDSGLLHGGSVGKTLYAALALQLVAEGRVQLDAPVSRYLGHEAWFSAVPNAEGMTVRMLLNHTSGVPEYGSILMTALIDEPGRPRTPLDAVKSVLGQPPVAPPGARFAYSDVNYQLLQLAVERVTGERAEDAIRALILDPYRFTRIVPTNRRVIRGLVQGYAGPGNFLGFDSTMVDGALILDPSFEGGGGGFATNAGDLARWIALFGSGALFDSALVREMRRGVSAGQMDVGADARVGLGVEYVTTPFGIAYGHGGFFPGYLTLALWYPHAGVALAIQVNSSASNALSRPLRDVLLDAVRALQ